jgi:hypothetical protein
MLQASCIILSFSILASAPLATDPREPELHIQTQIRHPLMMVSSGARLEWKHDISDVRNAAVSWIEDQRYSIALTRQDGSLAILRTDRDLGWRNDYSVTWSSDGTSWSQGAIDWISLSPSGRRVCLIEEPGRCVVVLLDEKPTIYQVPAIGFTIQSKAGAKLPEIPSADADLSDWNGVSVSRLAIKSVYWSDDETSVYISYADGRVLQSEVMRPNSIHAVRTSTWQWCRRILTQSAWSKVSGERSKLEQGSSVVISVGVGGMDVGHSIVGCSDGNLVLKKDGHMLCVRAATGEGTWCMDGVYEARCVGKHILAAVQDKGELFIAAIDTNTGAVLLKHLLSMYNSPELASCVECSDRKGLSWLCLLSALNTQRKSRESGVVFVTDTSTTMSLTPIVVSSQKEKVIKSSIRTTANCVRLLTVSGTQVTISTIPVLHTNE